MKFLTTSRNKDSYYALAPEKRLELMIKTYAYIEKHLKSGKCKEVLMHGDLKGGVSIWEVGSSEEVARLMIENPMYAFVDMEGQPLIELDVAKKAVTAYVKKLAKK